MHVFLKNQDRVYDLTNKSLQFIILFPTKDYMKKIVFIQPDLSISGLSKSLVELLHVIPMNEYEVHVGFYKMVGEFLPQLPPEVHIHKIDSMSDVSNGKFFLSLLKSFRLIDAFVFFTAYLHDKFTAKRYWIFHYKNKNVPFFMDGELFDMVISYNARTEMCSYYAMEKVRAKVKCFWIHQDVSYITNRFEIMNRFGRECSKIFLPCEEAKRRFDLVFPNLKDKSDVFYCIISVEKILRLASQGETFDDSFDGKRLLTVGRLSDEKGQKMAIRSLKILLEKGNKVKWYFIGDGKDKDVCKQLATELGFENNVVFLGANTNPYRYMQDCDVYVQPSLSESFCMTLTEVLCFGNPIVCTNFCGVEQLKGRANGYIVDISVEALADGVEKALLAPKLDVLPKQRTPDIDKLFSLIQ